MSAGCYRKLLKTLHFIQYTKWFCRHLYQDDLKKCFCVLNQHRLNVNFIWRWATKLSLVLIMATNATILVVFLDLILVLLS